MERRVLVIDPSQAQLRGTTVAASLQSIAECAIAPGIPEAVALLSGGRFSLVYVCLPLPDSSPDDFLEWAANQTSLQLSVIFESPAADTSAQAPATSPAPLDPDPVAAQLHALNQFGPYSESHPPAVTPAELAAAVRLLRSGAFDYLPAPPDAAYWRSALECLPAAQDTGHQPEAWRNRLIGDSPAMRELHDVIRLVAARRSTVLILGETGAGKECIARALHEAGPRARFPFVAVNCAAIPHNLMEAELFGHVRGAFTGAERARTGRFEQADRGTLFLDEVGELPLELQAKLLRALQERQFERLGSSETVRVDVRVIAATNANLREKVAAGRFREDLYYRLNVIVVEPPPLRDRLMDIPPLARHFSEKTCAAEGLPHKQLTPEAITRLRRYEWPGNVRQLENAVEVAVVMSGERTTLLPGDFRLPNSTVPILRQRHARSHAPLAMPDEGIDFEEVIGAMERDLLVQALDRARGNKKRAAQMLGLKRTTLAAKLKSLDIPEIPVARIA